MINCFPGPRTNAEVLTTLRTFSITPTRTFFGEASQELHFGQTVGARIRRQFWCHERQIECCRLTNLGGQVNHTGIASESTSLFGATSQVCCCRGWQTVINLIKAATLIDCRNRGCQSSCRWRCIVNIVCRNALHIGSCRQLGHRIVTCSIKRVAVIPQFNQHSITTKRSDQLLQFAQCCTWTMLN